MDGRTDTGVKGFFTDYDKGTPIKAKPVQVEAAKVQSPKPPLAPAKPATTKAGATVRARVGRPPGVPNGARTYKLKTTVYVNADILDYYRDWSWEARCNLGELVERALVAYKAQRNRPSNKKTTHT
jgi:hypothetical protein